MISETITEAVAEGKPLTPRSILRRNNTQRSPVAGAGRKRVTFEEKSLVAPRKNTGGFSNPGGKLARRSATNARRTARRNSQGRASNSLLRPARGITTSPAAANSDDLSPPSTKSPAFHDVKAPARARPPSRNGADFLAGEWCRGIAKGLAGSSMTTSGSGVDGIGIGDHGCSGKGRGLPSLPRATSSRGHRMFQLQEAMNRAASSSSSSLDRGVGGRGFVPSRTKCLLAQRQPEYPPKYVVPSISEASDTVARTTSSDIIPPLSVSNSEYGSEAVRPEEAQTRYPSRGRSRADASQRPGTPSLPTPPPPTIDSPPAMALDGIDGERQGDACVEKGDLSQELSRAGVSRGAVSTPAVSGTPGDEGGVADTDNVNVDASEASAGAGASASTSDRSAREETSPEFSSPPQQRKRESRPTELIFCSPEHKVEKKVGSSAENQGVSGVTGDRPRKKLPQEIHAPVGAQGEPTSGDYVAPAAMSLSEDTSAFACDKDENSDESAELDTVSGSRTASEASTLPQAAVGAQGEPASGDYVAPAAISISEDTSAFACDKDENSDESAELDTVSGSRTATEASTLPRPSGVTRRSTRSSEECGPPSTSTPRFEFKIDGIMGGSSPSRSTQSIPVVSPPSDKEATSGTEAQAAASTPRGDAKRGQGCGLKSPAGGHRRGAGMVDGDGSNPESFVGGRNEELGGSVGIAQRRGKRSGDVSGVEVSALSWDASLPARPAVVEESPLSVASVATSVATAPAAAAAAAAAAATVSRLLGKNEDERDSPLFDTASFSLSVSPMQSPPSEYPTLTETSDGKAAAAGGDIPVAGTEDCLIVAGDKGAPPTVVGSDRGEAPEGEGKSLDRTVSSDATIPGAPVEDAASRSSYARAQTATPKDMPDASRWTTVDLGSALSESSSPPQNDDAVASRSEPSAGRSTTAETAPVVCAAGPSDEVTEADSQVKRVECPTPAREHHSTHGRVAAMGKVGRGCYSKVVGWRRRTRSDSRMVLAAREARDSESCDVVGGKACKSSPRDIVSSAGDEREANTGKSLNATPIEETVAGRGERKRKRAGKLLRSDRGGGSGSGDACMEKGGSTDGGFSDDFTGACAEELVDERPPKRGRGRPRKTLVSEDTTLVVSDICFVSGQIQSLMVSPEGDCVGLSREAGATAMEVSVGKKRPLEACYGGQTTAAALKVRGWMAPARPSRPCFSLARERGIVSAASDSRPAAPTASVTGPTAAETVGGERRIPPRGRRRTMPASLRRGDPGGAKDTVVKGAEKGAMGVVGSWTGWLAPKFPAGMRQGKE